MNKYTNAKGSTAEAVRRITACERDHRNDLDLSRLALLEVPAQIGQLTSLTRLNLGGNHLKTLPQEIGNLAKLIRLDVSGNYLTTLPQAIRHLTSLEELSLNHNAIEELPPEIGELRSLKDLFLQDNKLKALPAEIGKLSKLRWLDLERNHLTSLPREIRNLESLPQLFLSGNKDLGIPSLILGATAIDCYEKRRPAARPCDILNYFFECLEAEEGTLRPLNEIKVMLVGRGGAGKTSLRRFFMGHDHDKSEKETPGIALDTFELECQKGKIKVRLWDFAGQEITHALHQFFLTEGCVYIVVLDPRSNTEMQDAEYWLTLLNRYAAGAPILVALNHQDARMGGYDIDRRALMERFRSIQDFVRTNCELREGCQELQQKLCNAVDALKDDGPPHMKVPGTWLKVMESCEGEAHGWPSARANKLRQTLIRAGHKGVAYAAGRKYLTLEEFQLICSENGETDPEQQRSLARLLHSLGAVLHFVDEPRLRHTSVLDPHWVTDGVYRLLRFRDAPGSDGILTIKDALRALPGEREEETRFLLRLMERFEMCFSLDHEDGGRPPTKWLIPGALGEFQPEDVTSAWQRPGSVRIRYLYNPLPEGVLPRFIVMTRLLSDGQPRWRNGVVLKDLHAESLVRRGKDRNHIEVTAFGSEQDRLRLLEIIQGNLDRIHTDLPAPAPIEEVELAGLPGVFRSVADLEAAELGEQQVAVDSPRGAALVEPTAILNRTSEPEARGDRRVPLNAYLSYSHRDLGAKALFEENLTLLMKKRFIKPWHDGLIEPGVRWREEIETQLSEMDLFIGLVTTAFLNSDFIAEVELRRAHQRVQGSDKGFLFVLILVENISLRGLELNDYQLLIPGGKPVCQHASRRIGFNIAQEELETLIQKRQADIKSRKGGGTAMPPLPNAEQPLPGITFISPVASYDRMGSGADPYHSQAVTTLANCERLVSILPSGAVKSIVEDLMREVAALLRSLPTSNIQDAPEIADMLEVLIKQVARGKPSREWYSLSATGLMEASRTTKGAPQSPLRSLIALGKEFWPGFHLPAGVGT